MSLSKLDADQIIQDVHDVDNHSLRTNATIVVPGGIEVAIDQADDSISIGDGTTLFTGTTVGPDHGLDVNIIGGELDINLLASEDSVESWTHDGSGNSIGSTGDALHISDAGGSLTVDAVNLDIRDLNSLQDNIAISDGINVLTVNNDGSINTTLVGGPITVTATDLDIRNLDAAQDSVSAHLLDNNGNPFSTINPLPTTIAENQSLNKISGTIDGLKTGTEYGFVNNLKLQILASHDRIETYTYSDFGTKDQRISKVEYSSATFSGFTVERTFNYVLDSGRYRRTTVNWNII